MRLEPTSLCLGFVTLVCLVIYLTGLSPAFLLELDDEWLILENPAIREFSLESIGYILFEDIRDLSYQPLMYISLAGDIALFGYDAYAFKVHNLILHILAGWAIYFFFVRLTANRWLAFGVAALFLLHPIQVENIAWTTLRRQVQFVLWYFLALHAYLSFTRASDRARRALAGTAFLLAALMAFLAKFTAVVLLPTVLLVDVFVHRLTWRKFPALLFRRAGIIALLGLFIVIFAKMNARADQLNPVFLKSQFDYTVWQYALISLKSFGFYLVKAVWPAGLAPYYPETPAGQAFGIAYYLYALFAVALFAIWLYLWQSKRFLATLLLGVYLVSILPVSTRLFLFSDLPWNNGDRYFYGPSAFVFALLLVMAARMLKPRRLRLTALAFVLAALSLLTWRQLQPWKSSIALFSHTVQLYPNSEFFRRLAAVYMLDGQHDKAYEALLESREASIQNNINVLSWTYMQMAFIALKNGDAALATGELRKALARDGVPDSRAGTLATELLEGGWNDFESFKVAYYTRALGEP